MRKKPITNVFRYPLIALIGCMGIAGIIASGGGGGDSTTTEEVVAGFLDGYCYDKLTGQGVDDAYVDLHKPLTSDKELKEITAQQIVLPTSEVIASTRTANGYYEFNNVPANETYFLTYTKVPYLDEAYFEVTVEPDSTDTLEPVPLLETQYDTLLGYISGSVTDARTGAFLVGVTIRVRGGINNHTGTVLQTATTELDGTFTVGPLDAGNYTLEAYLVTYQTAYFDALVLDTDGDPSNDEIILGTVALIPESIADLSFAISGHVYAAYDEFTDTAPYPLGGASMLLREGIDTTEDPVTVDGFTNSSGFYSLSGVLAGQYTLEGNHTGFGPGYTNISLGTNLENQNITLMPTTLDKTGQLTIVLTWGTTTNLNSILIEDSLAVIPSLNDDTDGFGPETTLVKLVDLKKVYDYSVRDVGGLIVDSKAQVRMYDGNHLIFIFDVPLSDPDAAIADIWRVFTIEAGTIVPINDLVKTIILQ